MLKYVAETLKNSTRTGDIPARMGGDEFLLFMEYKADMEAPVKRIFNILCGEFKGFPIRISMGVACAMDCNGDYETLFRMADEAMYAVKKSGRNSYRFYNEDLKKSLIETEKE